MKLFFVFLLIQLSICKIVHKKFQNRNIVSDQKLDKQILQHIQQKQRQFSTRSFHKNLYHNSLFNSSNSNQDNSTFQCDQKFQIPEEMQNLVKNQNYNCLIQNLYYFDNEQKKIEVGNQLCFDKLMKVFQNFQQIKQKYGSIEISKMQIVIKDFNKNKNQMIQEIKLGKNQLANLKDSFNKFYVDKLLNASSNTNNTQNIKDLDNIKQEVMTILNRMDEVYQINKLADHIFEKINKIVNDFDTQITSEIFEQEIQDFYYKIKKYNQFFWKPPAVTSTHKKDSSNLKSWVPLHKMKKHLLKQLQMFR